MKKYCFYFFAFTLFSKPIIAIQPKVTLVTEHLPPYQILNEDKSISGFAVDVVKEVFNRTNIDFSLQSYPWVRTYNLALQKSNHCVFSLARTKSREAKFQWIGAITESNNASIWALASNKNALKIKSLNDLKNFTTAVNLNDVTHKGMLDIGLTENKNLYVLRYSKSLINLLVTRSEIDFIVVDDITISHRSKLAGVPMESLQRVIEVKSLPLNFYLACNLKTDKRVIEKLTQSLSSVHQDGTYQKLLKKWKADILLNVSDL